MSQISVYQQTSGPGSGTVTSVSGGTGIVITGNPAINPTVNLIVPVVIANGGTNATSFSTVDGTVYYDGTQLVTTATGTSGQVLTSNGVGVAPTFQTGASTSITINGDVGSVTGSTITLTGGSSGAVFTGVGTTLTESFNFLAIPNTNTGATAGYISLGGSIFLSNYGTGIVNFFGAGAGNSLVGNTSQANIAIGASALSSVTTGGGNVAIGYNSLNALTTAGLIGVNTAVGFNTGSSITTGSANLLLGSNAGSLLTGSDSNNIFLSNNGMTGDNHVLRIGNQGTSQGQQNTCFIAGIQGVTTSNSQMVTFNSVTTQLGVATIPNAAVTWSVITADQSAVVNAGYICNKAGLLTLTLPTTAVVGSIIRVTGINTALGWKIAQSSGQTIYFGSSATTTGATGSLASAAIRDTVEIVCVVANNDWNVLSSIGNITVT